MAIATRSTLLQGLRCRACGELQPADERYVCAECLGPIEPEYELDRSRAEDLRAEIAEGPRTLWRYAPLLPVRDAVGDSPVGWTPLIPAPRLSAVSPVGWTPLIPAPRLSAALGITHLYVKDDT